MIIWNDVENMVALKDLEGGSVFRLPGVPSYFMHCLWGVGTAHCDGYRLVVNVESGEPKIYHQDTRVVHCPNALFKA